MKTIIIVTNYMKVGLASDTDYYKLWSLFGGDILNKKWILCMVIVSCIKIFKYNFNSYYKFLQFDQTSYYILKNIHNRVIIDIF